MGRNLIITIFSQKKSGIEKIAFHNRCSDLNGAPGRMERLLFDQRAMDTQTKQELHQEVALLTPFSSSDVVSTAIFVFPNVLGGFRTFESGEW